MKTRVDNLEKILGRERVELEAQHEFKNAIYVKTLKMYLEGGVKEALDKGLVPLKHATAEEDSEGDEEAQQDENIPTFQRRVLAKREKLYDLVIDDDDWKSNEVNNATMMMRSSSSSYFSSSAPGKSSSSVSRL
jgi:methyl coenzyme M reductase alpha subunit